MIPIIDMHCDTVYCILKHELRAEMEKTGADSAEGQTIKNDGKACETRDEYALRKNDGHLDLERMKNSAYMCQCFAMYTPLYKVKELGLTPFEYVMKLNAVWDREIGKNPDLIRQAYTGTEIENNYKNGIMSALKSVEEGAAFEGSINKMKLLYDKGVRMSTLTWNFENELAFPNQLVWETDDGVKHSSINEPLPDPKVVDKSRINLAPDFVRGLKAKGREMVEAMEATGMLVDVSHLNDAGIKDVLDIVKKDTPIIASHSNARSITGHPRNLTDEMIRKIADHGGVTGLNFASDFLNDRHDDMSLYADLVTHAKYLKNVGGVEVIGFGSDFDGIENAMEFEGCQGMQKIAEAFEKAGFTSSEIEKIFYKNALRVFKTVLG